MRDYERVSSQEKHHYNVRGAMNCATTNAFLLEKNITNTNVRGAMNCATTNAFLLEKNITIMSEAQ